MKPGDLAKVNAPGFPLDGATVHLVRRLETDDGWKAVKTSPPGGKPLTVADEYLEGERP